MAVHDGYKTRLKNGYYIEVNGIKIRRETEEQIKVAFRRYKKSHNTKYLGKVKNGVFVEKHS